jgi:hypothetical protein
MEPRVIVALVTVVVLSCCAPGAKSPSDVVVSVYSAANSGQYDQADKYFSPRLKDIERADGGAKLVWDANTRGRQLRSIAVRESTSDNNSATVVADLTFNNGCTTRLTVSLRNEWRAWPPSQEWLITRIDSDSRTCRPFQGNMSALIVS